jgi:thermosome subunit
LAENAGLDAVDVLTELRHIHESKEDGWKYGINAFTGKVSDMWTIDVIEPLTVKLQALKAAVEAATMVLRIDEIIAASKLETGKGEEKKEGGEEESKSGSSLD